MTRSELETLGQELTAAFDAMHLPPEKHEGHAISQIAYLPQKDHIVTYVRDSDGEAIATVEWIGQHSTRDSTFDGTHAERKATAAKTAICQMMAHHRDLIEDEPASQETVAPRAASQWV